MRSRRRRSNLAPRLLARGLMLTDMEGRAIALDTLRGADGHQPAGDMVYLQQRELPMLAEVAAISRVLILLVNQAGQRLSPPIWPSAVAGTQVYLDHSGQTGDAAGGLVLPTTLFVDAVGRIVRRHSGEISRAALADGLALTRGARVRTRKARRSPGRARAEADPASGSMGMSTPDRRRRHHIGARLVTRAADIDPSAKSAASAGVRPGPPIA